MEEQLLSSYLSTLSLMFVDFVPEHDSRGFDPGSPIERLSFPRCARIFFLEGYFGPV
jgi:hypothetical protein